MGMLNIIKQAANEANTIELPVRIMQAVVLDPPPELRIILEEDRRRIYKEEHFIVPQRLTTYKQKIKIDGVEKEIEVLNELAKGDLIEVASVQGADTFYILDRVGS